MRSFILVCAFGFLTLVACKESFTKSSPESSSPSLKFEPIETAKDVHPCFEGTDISGDAVTYPLNLIKMPDGRKGFEFLGAVLTTTGTSTWLAELNLRTKAGNDVPFTIREPEKGAIYYSPMEANEWTSRFHFNDFIMLPKETIGRCLVTVIFGPYPTFPSNYWPQMGIWIRDDGQHGLISTLGDDPVEVGGSATSGFSKIYGHQGQFYFLQLAQPFDNLMVFGRTSGSTTEILSKEVAGEGCVNRFHKTSEGFLMGASDCQAGDKGWLYRPDSNSWTSVIFSK
jgi:hypothetical protein